MGQTLTLLPDGAVLVAGGCPAGRTERFDPITERFLASGSLAEPRQGHTATLLRDGRVLVVGGYGASALASAEQWSGSGE